MIAWIERGGAWALVGLLLALAAGPALAFEKGDLIEGPATALDGDTLWIKGTRVRLWGISAPEMSDWPYGAWARAGLDLVIEDSVITCSVVDVDRHKRPVAVCKNATKKRELGTLLLEVGMAVVYRRFTVEPPPGLEAMARLYDESERAAQQQGRGIWSDAARR